MSPRGGKNPGEGLLGLRGALWDARWGCRQFHLYRVMEAVLLPHRGDLDVIEGCVVEAVGCAFHSDGVAGLRAMLGMVRRVELSPWGGWREGLRRLARWLRGGCR